jgi:pyruvate/oxaloacetate carboxyltransferase
MVMAKVKITDTILRDAHQSQAATRMRLEEMLPIADKLDKVGYHSLEVWGGATFDSCLRFLKEDPWERLRTSEKGHSKYQATNVTYGVKTCLVINTMPMMSLTNLLRNL